MARLISSGLIFALSAVSGTAAAEQPQNILPVPDRATPSRNFGLPGEKLSRRPDIGARIIAGREVMPNGTIGIGLFDHRPSNMSPAPVTARELPRQRRAAVGFSLRF